jgi:hypothetical protein
MYFFKMYSVTKIIFKKPNVTVMYMHLYAPRGQEIDFESKNLREEQKFMPYT